MADIPNTSFAMELDSGTLMFPSGTALMELSSKARKHDESAVALTLAAYAKQLSGLPEVKDPTRKPAPELGTVEEIKRPSGEVYVPRMVRAGGTVIQDVPMVRKAFEERIPVLLYGPPGTGKTALCEAALENLVTVAGTGDTETADFVGGYVQNADGTFTWVDGPMIVAMENGWPLLIDEVALIDSKVMAVVYSVMDGRGELFVSANPARGRVKAKDGFYVVGACNPDVPGAVMSEALLSRFLLHVEVLTDFDLAQKLGVAKEIVVVAKNLQRKQQAGDIIKAPQMRELLGFKKVSEAFGQDAALANFIGIAEPSDRNAYADAVSSAYGRKIQALAIAA